MQISQSWRVVLVYLALAVSACTGGNPSTCPDGSCTAALTGSIVGTVTAGGTAALAGASIALLGTDHVASTDASGKFRLERVAAGTYTVQATAAGFQPAHIAELEVKAGQTSVATVALSAAPGQPGSGTVTGFAKLADSAIHSTTLVFLEGTSSVAFTAVNGAFVLAGVPSGTYVLVARHEGYADVRVTGLTVHADGATDAGTMQLVPQSGPTGGVSGTITSAAGPLSGAAVYLAGTSASAVTGADGKFIVSGVLPGTYDLIALVAGYETKTTSAIAIAAGSVVSAGVISLSPVGPASSPFGRLVGRATRAGATTGNAGITVYVEGSSLLAYTADDGSFTIDQLLPGAYTLGAAARGYLVAQSGSATVVVGKDSTVPQIDLQLDPGGAGPLGTVAGRALLLGKTDNSGTSVTLAGQGLSVSTQTAADGTYQFVNVPSGVYGVTCSHVGYQPASIDNAVAITGVFHAADMTLYPGAKMDGRVLSSGTLLSNGTKALLTFNEGPDSPTYEYSVAARSLQTAAPATASLCGSAADGSFATVTMHDLYRFDPATVAFDPITPPMTGTAWSDNGVRCAYMTATGLATVQPGSIQGTELIGKPCPGATINGTGRFGSSNADWIMVSASGQCSGVYQSSFALLNLSTGVHTGYSVYSYWLSPDQKSVVFDETDFATGQRTLKRVDFQLGTVSVLATGVTRVFTKVASGQSVVSGAFSLTDAATGRGSLIAIDASTGTTTTLLTGAQVTGSNYVAGNEYVIALAGTPERYNVVRFDLQTTHALCAAGGILRVSAYPFSSQDHAYSCASSTAPYEIAGYDPVTDTARVFTSAGQSWQTIGQVFTWSDAVGSWAASVASTAPAIKLDSQVVNYGVQSDGKWFLVAWDSSDGTPRLLAYPLAGGTPVLLLRGTAAESPRSLYGAAASPRGRRVLAFFDPAVGADPLGCGPSKPQYCMISGDTQTTVTDLFPAGYPQSWATRISFASDDSGVMLTSTYPTVTTTAIRFPPGSPATAMTFNEAWYNSNDVWGPGSDRAIATSPLGTPWVLDLVTNSRSALRTNTTPTRLGTSSEYLVGATVVNLSDGTSHDFGSLTILGWSPDHAAFTYIDGSGVLGRYVAGTGIAQLGVAAYLPVTPNLSASAPLLVLTDFNGAVGNLASLDPTTGTLTPVAAQISRNLIASSQPVMFAFQNPDLVSGDLLAIRSDTLAVTPLHARARWSGQFFSGTKRVAFTGQLPGDPTPRSFVANLDGSGAHKLSDTVAYNLQFSSDESRAFFSAGTLWWAEDRAGGPSIAIDDSQGYPVLTNPSGTTVLYGRSRGDFPASIRNGTYRVDLP